MPIQIELSKMIFIQAVPRYVPEESDPKSSRFVFGYTITIKNLGTMSAQLISRHWVITNGYGHVEEVSGMGVVGTQPHLKPGQEFSYSSFCPLTTPTGSMKGHYQMVLDNGTQFDVEIPTFYLIEPQSYH